MGEGCACGQGRKTGLVGEEGLGHSAYTLHSCSNQLETHGQTIPPRSLFLSPTHSPYCLLPSFSPLLLLLSSLYLLIPPSLLFSTLSSLPLLHTLSLLPPSFSLPLLLSTLSFLLPSPPSLLSSFPSFLLPLNCFPPFCRPSCSQSHTKPL